MNVGFGYVDACAWADQDHDSATTHLVVVAQEFRDAGFTVVEGLRWHVRDYQPHTAAVFANNGWVPEFVDTMRVALWAQIENEPVGQRMAAVYGTLDWVVSGIRPQMCLLYARAGFSLDEAHDFERRRSAGEPIESTLRFLAALIGS